jgi:2-oxoglutarate ferredoxin oxidoreductase subunit gamma
MRGGTANCSVILSDEEIGSPIVNVPDILFSFTIQSFDKFEPTIAEGGILLADSTLISKQSARSDIKAFYIPATELADKNDLKGGANVIMLGKFVKESGIFSPEEFIEHMVASIPASKAKLIENNKKAFSIGYNYEG